MSENTYGVACNPIFFVTLDLKRIKEPNPRSGCIKERNLIY